MSEELPDPSRQAYFFQYDSLFADVVAAVTNSYLATSDRVKILEIISASVPQGRKAMIYGYMDRVEFEAKCGSLGEVIRSRKNNIPVREEDMLLCAAQ